MDEEKIEIDVLIEMADSAKSVKDLSKSIDSLSGALEGLTKDTDDYRKVEEALNKTTKQHNQLFVQQAIETAKNAKTVKDLTKAMKDLKSAQDLVDASSPDFAKLSKAINDTEGKVGDLNDSFKTLTGSGMEKVNASLGLFKEGLMNADPGKLGVAMKGFGQALSAIPIFLVIEGLKYLYDNFDKVKKILFDIFPGLDSVSESTKNLEKENAKLTVSSNKLIKELENELRLGEAQGKSEKELLELKKKINAEKVAELKRSIAIQESKKLDIQQQDDLFEGGAKLYAQALRAMGRDKEAELYERGYLGMKAERTKEVNEEIAKSKQSLADLEVDLKIVEIETEKKVTENYKKQLDDREKRGEENFKKYQEELRKKKEAAENAANEEALVVPEIVQQQVRTTQEILDEANARKLSESALAAQAEIDLAKKTEIEKRKELMATFKMAGDIAQKGLAIAGQIQDIKKQKSDQELAAFNGQSEDKLNTLNAAKDAELAKDNLTEKQKVDIQNKFAQQEYQVKLQQYNFNQSVKKKEFDSNKKFAIASALINGSVAAVNALTVQPFIPGAIIALAGVATTTALSIAKISQSRYDAGGSPPQPPSLARSISAAGSTGGGKSGPLGSSQGQSQGNFLPPELQKIGDGDGNKMSSGQPTKAYVLGSDITNIQDKDAAIARRVVFSK